MKNKKSLIFLVVLLLIVTNIFTYYGAQWSFVDQLAHSSDGDTISGKAEYQKLISVKNFIKGNYLRDTEEQDFQDGMLKGLVASLGDPYSNYWTEEEFKALNANLSGVLYGVGITVTAAEDGTVLIIAPIKDGPAEKNGIMPGDKIVEVDGTSVIGQTLTEVTNMIKGELGTEVTLTISREGEEKTSEYVLTREKIKLETVSYDKLDNGIAYVNLTEFSTQSGKEFKEIMKKVTGDSSKGVILDLRSNPGGSLSACVEIADQLLGEGLIVYTEKKGGILEDEYFSDGNFMDLPMVVLVNGGSASASEILSGAIKDHERALLIGETTFGKGVVQTVKDLPDGDGITLTISEYFLPNGENIHGKGVEPDIEVKLTEGVKRIGLENLADDNQLQRAIEEINDILK